MPNDEKHKSLRTSITGLKYLRYVILSSGRRKNIYTNIKEFFAVQNHHVPQLFILGWYGTATNADWNYGAFWKLPQLIIYHFHIWFNSKISRLPVLMRQNKACHAKVFRPFL